VTRLFFIISKNMTRALKKISTLVRWFET